MEGADLSRGRGLRGPQPRRARATAVEIDELIRRLSATKYSICLSAAPRTRTESDKLSDKKVSDNVVEEGSDDVKKQKKT